MFPELCAARRDPVPGGIVPAAIKGPGIIAEASADDAGSNIAIRAAERDICLALAEVAKILAVVELDHGFGVAVVQLAQDRREQRHREYLLRGNANGAAGVTLF